MAYLPNKPQANDLLSVSQGDIQGNFLTANTVIAIDHFPFDDTSPNQGKHKFVTMPIFSATVFPPPTIPANVAGEGLIYTLNANSVASLNEVNLFYTPGTTPVSTRSYQLTRTVDASGTEFGSFTNYPPMVASQNGGWTFLPGGLLLQYGEIIGSSGVIVTYPIEFTDTASPYSLNVTRRNANPGSSGFSVSNITKKVFSIITNDSGSPKYSWMAIGK